MITVRNLRGGGARMRDRTVSERAAQQRAQLGAAVDVEQDELAAVRRQLGIEPGDDRPRAHREVDDGLEGEDGRQAVEKRRHARRARCGSCSAAVRRYDWRAPLTGKELYLNGLNSGRMPSHAALAKAGSSAGKRGEAGKARKARDADHRRDQDQAVGPRQLLVVESIEGILHRQRAAVGEAHDVQRLLRAGTPSRLAHGEPRGRVPILPFDVGQAGRHGAVAPAS